MNYIHQKGNEFSILNFYILIFVRNILKDKKLKLIKHCSIDIVLMTGKGLAS